MNVAGINFESIVDGEGVRVVVFVSGCLHNCIGCHNPASHPFTVGQPFTSDLQEEILNYLRQTPFVSGITLSGGDPMYSAGDLIGFIKKLKADIPSASIWIYSGFTYEEILADEEMKQLLILCDVLVDGEFDLNQRDITLSYRGSRNQRIIDISQSLQKNDVVLYMT